MEKGSGMLTTYCPLHHRRQEVTQTASFKISTKKSQRQDF
jgi:hypothetical protein